MSSKSLGQAKDGPVDVSARTDEDSSEELNHKVTPVMTRPASNCLSRGKLVSSEQSEPVLMN